MIAKRLKNFLDRNRIHYDVIVHPNTYTAAATGAIAHIPGREIAKTVMVKVDGKISMAVIPGSRHLDIAALKSALGAKQVALLTEDEFASSFSDCEVGAMPPFGLLYDVPVYADERLASEPEIFFNAGTHRELMQLKYHEFDLLQHPKLMRIATQTAAEKQEEERLGIGSQNLG